MRIGGTMRVVPPLSKASLHRHRQPLQDLASSRLDNFENVFARMSVLVDATHEALQRNYPSITRAEVAAGVDLENMRDVLSAITDVDGTRRCRSLANTR